MISALSHVSCDPDKEEKVEDREGGKRNQTVVFQEGVYERQGGQAEKSVW